MFTGIAIGFIGGFLLNLVSMNSYKRILVMKSKDGTAEHIHGKFYYITEENKQDTKKR